MWTILVSGCVSSGVTCTIYELQADPAPDEIQRHRIRALADLLKSLRKKRSGLRKLRRPLENVKDGDRSPHAGDHTPFSTTIGNKGKYGDEQRHAGFVSHSPETSEDRETRLKAEAHFMPLGGIYYSSKVEINVPKQ